MTPTAWGTPDPGAPDRDVSTVDGAEAVAALAVAVAAEDEQRRATRTPGWFGTSIALCLGVIVGANAISTEWIRATVLTWTVAVELLLIMSMVRSWRRRGVRPQLFSSLDTPAGVVQLVAAGVVMLGTLPLSHVRPDWALALGAVAAVGYTGVFWAHETWRARHTGTASA